jgi:hypothetical protein
MPADFPKVRLRQLAKGDYDEVIDGSSKWKYEQGNPYRGLEAPRGALMIHYSCDLCHRPLEPSDSRYVVHIEMYPAVDPPEEEEWDDDRDYLSELHESLETGALNGEPQDESHGDPYRELRFDLCADCRKRFARDPLGRDLLKQFDFSKN